MSDKHGRKAIKTGACVGFLCCIVPLGVLAESNSNTNAITAGGAKAITAGGAKAITAGGAKAITAGGAQAITAGGARAITAGGARAITAGGAQAITAGGARAITAGGARAITAGGADLLVVGVVDAIDGDFMSVLGQSVFGRSAEFRGLSIGSNVAVFGSIDRDTGGIVNARVVPAAGELSYLRGIVDQVDYAMGRAVVSGVNVDYNALLSNGQAPRVGDELAITGRAYKGLGLLVAQP
jgi:hypothetical protein